MKGNREQIIRALRCSSTPGCECIGKKCVYCVIGTIERDGEMEQWEGCDCDRIALDAAQLLEETDAADRD